MNINEFEKVVKELTEDRNKVAEGKREDYTKGDVDVLKNFKNQAEALGVTPETSLAVHMEKQFSAVLNYIKTDGQSESEPIIKRIGDTINYLELLWGLINEEEAKGQDKELVAFKSYYYTYPLDSNEWLRGFEDTEVTLDKTRTLIDSEGNPVMVSKETILDPVYE